MNTNRQTLKKKSRDADSKLRKRGRRTTWPGLLVVLVVVLLLLLLPVLLLASSLFLLYFRRRPPRLYATPRRPVPFGLRQIVCRHRLPDGVGTDGKGSPYLRRGTLKGVGILSDFEVTYEGFLVVGLFVEGHQFDLAGTVHCKVRALSLLCHAPPLPLSPSCTGHSSPLLTSIGLASCFASLGSILPLPCPIPSPAHQIWMPRIHHQSQKM